MGASLTLSPAALAHDIWLSAHNADQSNASVVLTLLIAENTGIESMGFNPARIERLWEAGAKGVRPLTVVRAQPNFDIGPSSGPRAIGYVSKPSISALAGPAFDDYLREEHLQTILRQRQEQQTAASVDPKQLVTESYSRSLKLLLGDSDQAVTDCTLGSPLELTVVAADQQHLIVRARFQGKPLSGLWVDRGGADGEPLTQGVTDAEGRVALTRAEGEWILRATHMQASDSPEFKWRSWWATTTFKLGAAGVAPCLTGNSDRLQ